MGKEVDQRKAIRKNSRKAPAMMMSRGLYCRW